MSKLATDSRCLVTGASGFLGSALCSELKRRGNYVRALHRTSAQGEWDDQVLCALGKEFIPDDALNDIDYVFHLAGKAHDVMDEGDPQDYWDGTVHGTEELVRACERVENVKRVVFVSTLAVMPESATPLSESATPEPQTPYGEAKLEAESMLLKWANESHYEVAILRPAMIYGPGCKGNLLRMIDATHRGWFPPLPPNTGRRSMIHIEDVVDALLRSAVHDGALNGMFIVTDGREYTIREIYDWICEAIGQSSPQWHVPMWSLKMLAKLGDLIGNVRGRRFLFDTLALEKLVGNAIFDSSKIERELGFKPSHDLHNSMSDIVSTRLEERRSEQSQTAQTSFSNTKS